MISCYIVLFFKLLSHGPKFIQLLVSYLLLSVCACTYAGFKALTVAPPWGKLSHPLLLRIK